MSELDLLNERSRLSRLGKNYMTASENVAREKRHCNTSFMLAEMDRVKEAKMMPIRINGVSYDCLAQACRCTNISMPRLKEMYKQLAKTKLSEIEVNFNIKTKFTFQKIK